MTPAAFRTVKVAELVERLTPAPGVESTIVSTSVSSQEYLILSRVTALFGNDEGPFEGAASARYTGPETTRAYVWPPRSRRPLALPVHVPVPLPVQQEHGVPAAVHWLFAVSSQLSRRRLLFRSSFGPVTVIWPAIAPPAPRLTLT